MKLDPISRVSVVESVTERILALISSGQVKPGQHLPSEHELGAKLGVGRSSVREAMRSLAILGIVKAQNGKGTLVISPFVTALGGDLKKTVTQWGLLDVFEVRILLETSAAARAAEHATAENLKAILDAALAVEKRVVAKKRYFSENLRFHLKIADASNNPVLAHSLASIIGSLRDIREAVTPPQLPQADVDDHRSIVEAIGAGKPDDASRAMRAHLDRNVREIIREMAARNDCPDLTRARRRWTGRSAARGRSARPQYPHDDRL